MSLVLWEPAAPPMFLRYALFLLLISGCAAAGEDAGVDAGRADARGRADAGPEVDAAPGSPDAAPGSPDAAPPVDAAPGAPDAAPPPDAQSIVDTVLITEIVDATLAGGLPKFIEITNLGTATVDLADYSLGVYNNGGTTLNGSASTVLSGLLVAGDSYVVSFEGADSAGSGSFFDTYGFDPDNFGFGTIISGDDAIVLFRADGTGASGAATNTGLDATVVDSYGVVGVDGTGEPWEYLDGFATRRQASTTPSAAFDGNDWGFSGPDALDGMSAAQIVGLTSPGSH